MSSLFKKTNLLLLFIAFLWGVGFIFQRAAMDYMGPITFNAYRFIIAALCLLPFIFKADFYQEVTSSIYLSVGGGILSGCILFFAALFQQYSIQYTALANVGFITGLYVVIVSFLSVFLGYRYKKFAWFGVLFACYGLYLLSGFKGKFDNIGDVLALVGALFWAMHILTVSILVKKVSPYIIALIQFIACGVLSFMAALLFEENLFNLDASGIFWVLITGVIVTAFGYTLQIIAQAKAEPFHAAIIFSLEAVFAAIAAYLVFQEQLTVLETLGCLLMFLGCIMAQYPGKSKKIIAL
jgi:drug/metabolite transporter (DMT)-like permease